MSIFPRRRAAASPRTPDGRPAPRSRGRDGQTLVEFALVIPIFITVMLAVVEFAFLFNSVLLADYISRDASLTAAEVGNNDAADCFILDQIEQAITAPATPNNILQVVVYWDNASGKPANTYVRTGVRVAGGSDSTTCDLPGNDPTMVEPYRLTGGLNYAPISRCNIIAGCPIPNSTAKRPLDIIGVRVVYHYDAKTPLRNLVPFAQSYDLMRSNSARMEPVL
jgi:hypothetical protein